MFKRAVPVFIALVLITACNGSATTPTTTPLTPTVAATPTAASFEVVSPQELINKAYNQEKVVGRAFQITVTSEDRGDDYVVSEEYEWADGNSPVWFKFFFSEKLRPFSKGTKITIGGTLSDFGLALVDNRAGVMFFFRDCVVVSTK